MGANASKSNATKFVTPADGQMHWAEQAKKLYAEYDKMTGSLETLVKSTESGAKTANEDLELMKKTLQDTVEALGSQMPATFTAESSLDRIAEALKTIDRAREEIQEAIKAVREEATTLEDFAKNPTKVSFEGGAAKKKAAKKPAAKKGGAKKSAAKKPAKKH
jgi:septation ring formation regulator EzrA